MKKFLAAVLLCVLLFATGCPTMKQEDLSSYYSMVYKIGQDAFLPIAESYIESNDRVLIINAGQGFDGLGSRYEVEYKKLPKREEKEKSYTYNEYLQDHPFFVEYIESGFIDSIMAEGGIGFDRMDLPNYTADYVNRLREEEYIFGTSVLNYDWWAEKPWEEYKPADAEGGEEEKESKAPDPSVLKENFNVSKVLIYNLHKVEEKGVDYLGMQLGMKLIDVDNEGEILYDQIINVVSSNFPDSRRVFLNRLYLDLPQASVDSFRDKLDGVISYEGLDVDGGLNAVLVKTDDIPFLGTYPITIEDFLIEKELAQKLGGLDNFNVCEKLYKRRYKKPFQFVNAINHINPLRGGEYSEFENYYGTKYMLAYKVFWKEQTGKFEDWTEELVDLEEKIQGIYIKLIDMSDKGRILMTQVLPIAPGQQLEGNFLYKCFNRVNELPFLLDEIEMSAAIAPDERAVIINKRMEIFKNYLIREFPAYKSMYDNLRTNSETQILNQYDKIYKLFDEEEREDVKGEIYYIMAAHIMNGWFEEGITSYLVNNGYMVHDKLESIYSRYLIQYLDDGNWEGRDIFLSPIYLKEWGANIKNFYDLDKVIYFIALEKAVPETDFITPGNVTSETAAAELSQFYPILSYSLEWFLFSVLDVNSGDYALNRNYNLETGGIQ